MSLWSEIRHLAHQAFLGLLDQPLNVVAGLVSLLCGHGASDFWADETISAHSWRRRESAAWNRWRRLWDALFFWQDISIRMRTGVWPVERHCQRAYLSERERLGLPPEYRT